MNQELPAALYPEEKRKYALVAFGLLAFVCRYWNNRNLREPRPIPGKPLLEIASGESHRFTPVLLDPLRFTEDDRLLDADGTPFAAYGDVVNGIVNFVAAHWAGRDPADLVSEPDMGRRLVDILYGKH